MDEERIRERAERVRDAFNRETCRFGRANPMHRLLTLYGAVASCVSAGEYHRGGFFSTMVRYLGELGVDVSGVDTSSKPRVEGVEEAATNARDDTYYLWGIVSSWAVDSEDGYKSALSNVVDCADDLMSSLLSMNDGRVACCEDSLHRAVTDYIEHDAMGEVVGTIPREVPERVIFNPPATIAFWEDGTKTVARCDEGDEFSEHTGLLVCIAKRHLRVPRRATFEDAMAKLLKRAERRGPRPAGSGEAA